MGKKKHVSIDEFNKHKSILAIQCRKLIFSYLHVVILKKNLEFFGSSM